jgi:hypothetical protein
MVVLRRTTTPNRPMTGGGIDVAVAVFFSLFRTPLIWSES